MNPFGTGALNSAQDPRTVESSALAAPLPSTGGNLYSPDEIEHQHVVGICTGISVVQRRQKDTGKKYSPDFQYLLQKKFYDKAWYEGSSIFNALKVAKNYGFLPIEHFIHVTEADRYLPYSEYIKKLQAIPDDEINRLLALCVDKIPGYASVPVTKDDIAFALLQNPNGVLCRYDCGSTWWTPSWLPQDINPLRRPNPATSGHAIIMNHYDYTDFPYQVLSNTWGTLWNKLGTADINFALYPPTEVWTFLNYAPTIPKFTKNLFFGVRDPEVKSLQKILGVSETGLFWLKTLAALKLWQKAHNLKDDGYVGLRTRDILNKL